MLSEPSLCVVPRLPGLGRAVMVTVFPLQLRVNSGSHRAHEPAAAQRSRLGFRAHRRRFAAALLPRLFGKHNYHDQRHQHSSYRVSPVSATVTASDEKRPGPGPYSQAAGPQARG